MAPSSINKASKNVPVNIPARESGEKIPTPSCVIWNVGRHSRLTQWERENVSLANSLLAQKAALWRRVQVSEHTHTQNASLSCDSDGNNEFAWKGISWRRSIPSLQSTLARGAAARASLWVSERARELAALLSYLHHNIKQSTRGVASVERFRFWNPRFVNY